MKSNSSSKNPISSSCNVAISIASKASDHAGLPHLQMQICELPAKMFRILLRVKTTLFVCYII
jgi:hypothetical protein